MCRQCSDWNQSRKQVSKSKYNGSVTLTGDLGGPPRIEYASHRTTQSVEQSRHSLRGSKRCHVSPSQGRRRRDHSVCRRNVSIPVCVQILKFPIGHPVIHVGDACQDMQAMLLKDGLMKCSILPPRHLYHPVRPFRCNKNCYSAVAGTVL